MLHRARHIVRWFLLIAEFESRDVLRSQSMVKFFLKSVG